MRKLFLLALSVLFIGCSNKGQHTPVQEFDIFHTWVYDSPEKGVTESMTFTPDGVFYYSNKVTGMYEFENVGNMGRFSVIDNNITGSYELNGIPYFLDCTILDLSEYEITLKFNNTGLTFTYNKLVGSIDLPFMDKTAPDYVKFVDDEIMSFRSHDDSIIESDDTTGELEAVGVGKTYVDIKTEAGTAVLSVHVLCDYVDYSQYLNKTESEIREVFGNDLYRNTETKIGYELATGEIVIFEFDSMPRIVKTIGVDYSSSDIYDEEKMISFIGSKYMYSEDFSSDQVASYMDAGLTSLAQLSLIVNVVKGKSQVVYNSFNFAPFKDHSIALGKSKEEIHSLYYGPESELYYENDGFIIMKTWEENVSELSFYVVNDFVSAVFVYLNDNVDADAAHKHLSSLYTYCPDLPNEDELAYVSKDETFVIFYTISDNYVTYMFPY